MHTLLLRLDPTKDDVRMLEKAYYYIFQIHNSLVDYLKKQLRGMRRDKRYKNYIGRYHTLKKLVEKQPPDKQSPTYKHDMALYKYHKSQFAYVSRVLNELIEEYHLTKADCETYVKHFQHIHKHYIHSQQAQKEADRIYDGLSKVLYSTGKDLHFKKYNDVRTITGKSAVTGIIFDKKTRTIKMNKHVISTRDKRLEKAIAGEYEDIPKDVLYRMESMDHEIKYCELLRLMFMDGWHYYVRLYLDGEAPKKLVSGKGTTGIDPGVTTMAASNDKFVLFEELAPEVKKYNRKLASLQQGIDISKRYSNPGNYNADGTCIKGKCNWTYTDHCKRRMRELTVIYRKKSAYIVQSHNELCNKLMEKSDSFLIEHMNYAALARRSKKTERQDKATVIDGKSVHKFKRKKRFGKSVNDRAPSGFLTILQRKCKQYTLPYIEIDTKSFKASQYNHKKDIFEKIPLSQRKKKIGRSVIQRDLYSAFLIQNSNDTGTHADKALCDKKFYKFKKLHDEFVSNIKKSGRHLPNFGM